jgi:lysophospholipase L1-like esterase
MKNQMLRFFCWAWLLGFGQCTEAQKAPARIVNPPDKPLKIKYLALGDSYTIGEGVQEKERYPIQLADSLKKTGVEVSEVKIIARTGWRTDQLRQAIFDDVNLTSFNLVSLLIGVNNQYQGRDTATYRQEFKGLLQRALELAGNQKKRVFVLSIPDYGVTPFGQANEAKISREIDIFNRINREITLQAGIAYFDITPISRLAKTQPALLATDRLHPSGKMYKEWVKLIFAKVKKNILP